MPKPKQIMPKIYLFLGLLLLLTPAARAQFVLQPGRSDVTVVETRRSVQYVANETVNVSKSGRIQIEIAGARASALPLLGVGRLSGKMASNGTFHTSGTLSKQGASTTGRVQKNGTFTVTETVGDQTVKISGHATVAGFALTGTYRYTLNGSKVTGRIFGTFRPAF